MKDDGAITINIGHNKTVKMGGWYKTKKQHICRVEQQIQNNKLLCVSHYTGNKVIVPFEQAAYFVETDTPTSPPGTYFSQDADSTQKQELTGIYAKYAHIIPGSIYKVNTAKKNQDEDYRKILKDRKSGKKSKNTKVAGQTRCKIKCNCGNERDIKVQDAFQVFDCLDCKNKKRKKNLKSFLDKKKTIKNEK